jgi:DNA-binding LytR/AlgR family response regulator
MKIRLIINKRYEELQIQVCNHEKNEETDRLLHIVTQAVSETITGYTQNGVVMIPCESILRIYTQEQKIFAETADQTYRLHKRIYELEGILDERQFIRISNSEIVNLHKIKYLNTTLTGTIEMYLTGNIKTYVSRRYVTKIKKRLGI